MLAFLAAASVGQEAAWRRLGRLHEAHTHQSLAWSVGDVLETAAAGGAVVGAPELLRNASLCPPDSGAAGAGGGGAAACDLRYMWDRAQLGTALLPGAVHGATTTVVTGAVLRSRVPLGGRGRDGSRGAVAEALSGDRGFVFSAWWRGPTLRRGLIGLAMIGPPEWFHFGHGGTTSPVMYLQPGTAVSLRTALYGASTSRLVDRARPNDWAPFVSWAGIPPQRAGEDWYLDTWHHVVIAAGPRNRASGGMLLYIDGAADTLCALGQPGYSSYVVAPLADPGAEPGLPANASVACDWTRGEFCSIKEHACYPARDVSRLPFNDTQVVLSLGTDAWFDQAGVVALDSGGELASSSLRFTGAPFTAAARAALPESSPAAAAHGMPPVAGGRVVCAPGPMGPSTGGRTVCEARCDDPSRVVALSADVLCGPGAGALRESLDGAWDVCNATGGGRVVAGAVESATGVWRPAGGGGALWLVPAVTWPSPVGWSGAVGAVSRWWWGARSGSASSSWSDAGNAAWAESAPWPAVLRDARETSAGVDVGPAGGPPGDAASPLRCVAPPPLAAERWLRPVPQLVQVCLGGLAADPGARDAGATLDDLRTIDGLASRVRSEVSQLLGLAGTPDDDRVRVARGGAMLAREALTARAAVLGSEGGAAAAAVSERDLCAHGARAAVAAAGYGPLAGCVCLHVAIDTASDPGSLAAGRAPRGPAPRSAAVLAAVLVSALAASPAASTPLTALTSASPAGVVALPGRRCGSEWARAAGAAATGLGPGALRLLRTLAGGFAGSREVTLLPCADEATLAAAVAAAVAAWYAAVHGSVRAELPPGARAGGATELLPPTSAAVSSAEPLMALPPGATAAVFGRARGQFRALPREAPRPGTTGSAAGVPAGVTSSEDARASGSGFAAGPAGSAGGAAGGGRLLGGRLLGGRLRRLDAGSEEEEDEEEEEDGGGPGTGPGRADVGGSGTAGRPAVPAVGSDAASDAPHAWTDQSSSWRADARAEPAVAAVAAARAGDDDGGERAGNRNGERAGDYGGERAGDHDEERAGGGDDDERAGDACCLCCSFRCPRHACRDAVAFVPSAAAAATQAAVVSVLGVSAGRPAVLALAAVALGPLLCRVALLVACRLGRRRPCCPRAGSQRQPAEGARPGGRCGGPGAAFLRALVSHGAAGGPPPGGWRWASARVESRRALALALLLAAGDLRAPRLLFSGLCTRPGAAQVVPRAGRAAARRGLAAAEAAVSVPWAAAFAAGCVAALPSLEPQACEALSEASAREMAEWMARSAVSANVLVAPSCSLVGEGFWWVGLPCIVGTAVGLGWAAAGVVGAIGCGRAAAAGGADRRRKSEATPRPSARSAAAP